MSVGQEDTAAAQIVVIRRRGHDSDEGHHGGVWKIAYADFMTAMMAFFLVMWLINSSDQETRKGIANYFNPMQLAAEEPQARGVSNAEIAVDRDPEKKNMNGKLDVSASGGSGDVRVQQSPTGQDLFQDPYDILERLAKRASTGDDMDPKSRVSSGPQTTEETGAAIVDGTELRDPFDPTFRSQRPPARPSDAVGLGGDAVADGGAAAKPAERIAILNADKSTTSASGSEAAVMPPAAPPTESASQLRDDLAKALGRTIELGGSGEARGEAPAGVDGPTIEVSNTGDGILISLTDNSNFGMFAIASAEPKAEMIGLMEKVAGVLNARPGSLIVRGHTDSRPFRSGTNDNWRLSMARAHIAFHMLQRFGLDENRVERIEGYADRRLKVPDDPHASQNRRIEILLRPEEKN